uniref:Uncharacterized protein n=1 Tax=Heterorhabditis bacteriophora TaxID=37862 RepID=A0A1I7XTT8_HETBA
MFHLNVLIFTKKIDKLEDELSTVFFSVFSLAADVDQVLHGVRHFHLKATRRIWRCSSDSF